MALLGLHQYGAGRAVVAADQGMVSGDGSTQGAVRTGV